MYEQLCQMLDLCYDIRDELPEQYRASDSDFLAIVSIARQIEAQLESMEERALLRP
jgi:hypothetical protein